MPSRLWQVLTFTGVAGSGGQATLAHNINENGTAVKPDFLLPDGGDFELISCTTTAITVQNNGSTPATLVVTLWRIYSPERAFGGTAQNLTPQPFWVGGSGAEGGGGGGELTVLQDGVALPGTYTAINVVDGLTAANAGSGVATITPPSPPTWLREIQALSTDAIAPTLFGNLAPYTQMAKASGNYVLGGFYCDWTGNIEIVVQYAMSNANSGNVEMTFSYSKTAVNGDPAAALTATSPFVFTPGNNANLHELTSGVAAVLQLAVVAGQSVNVKLIRSIGGNDTHTGDLRIVRMFARAV